MLRATVEINLEGAAFWHNNDFDPAPEVVRILRQLANEIERNQPDANAVVWGTILRDLNGNDAGMFEMDCAIAEEE